MSQGEFPRISFGIIVLNGEPFTRNCVLQFYDHAHEIIVVEGACTAARNIAGDDGHSRDGTMETIRRIIESEDPQHKIILVTAEDEGHPNGFWPGEKTEQCAAYAKRATGDYIWEVGIDEFYRSEDIASIRSRIRKDPRISFVDIRQLPFWGSFDYVIDGWYYRGAPGMPPQFDIPRISKWGQGYRYVEHRPPTILDDQGRKTRTGKILRASTLARKGIKFYHYCAVFKKQLVEKLSYYHGADWKTAKVPTYAAFDRDVASRVTVNPFHVHFVQKYPSWLTRYRGDDPPAKAAILAAVSTEENEPAFGNREEIDRMLSSPRYNFVRFMHALGHALMWSVYMANRNRKRLFRKLALMASAAFRAR